MVQPGLPASCIIGAQRCLEVGQAPSSPGSVAERQEPPGGSTWLLVRLVVAGVHPWSDEHVAGVHERAHGDEAEDSHRARGERRRRVCRPPLSTPTICSSVNRLFRMSPSFARGVCHFRWPRSRGAGHPGRRFACDVLSVAGRPIPPCLPTGAGVHRLWRGRHLVRRNIHRQPLPAHIFRLPLRSVTGVAGARHRREAVAPRQVRLAGPFGDGKKQADRTTQRDRHGAPDSPNPRGGRSNPPRSS